MPVVVGTTASGSAMVLRVLGFGVPELDLRCPARKRRVPEAQGDLRGVVPVAVDDRHVE